MKMSTMKEKKPDYSSLFNEEEEGDRGVHGSGDDILNRQGTEFRNKNVGQLSDHRATEGPMVNFSPASLRSRVVNMKCPLCGISMLANAANMCTDCLRKNEDLSKYIHLMNNGIILQCKRCLQYQTRSKQWIDAEWESPELLSLALKYVSLLENSNVNGVQSNIDLSFTSISKVVTLKDASFVYTEPHSKRLKLHLRLQKEILNGALIQQQEVVEFVIKTMQCDNCNKSFTPYTWKALAQIRQSGVSHKKSFFLLEQKILNHPIHKTFLDVESVRGGGMNFYFQEKADCVKFAALVSSLLPTKQSISRKLIGEDVHSNTHRSQHTMIIDIAPICKDDLVYNPQVTNKSLLLVSKITSSIRLMNPYTLINYDISTTKYWKAPFRSILSSISMIRFEVLDVEILDNPYQNSFDIQGDETSSVTSMSGQQSKHGLYRAIPVGQLAEIEVARTSDFGSNNTTFRVTSHLGHMLEAGDSCLGYDLVNANFSADISGLLDKFRLTLPDIVLVKKYVDKKVKIRKRKSHQRTEKTKLPNTPFQESVTDENGSIDALPPDSNLENQQIRQTHNLDQQTEENRNLEIKEDGVFEVQFQRLTIRNSRPSDLGDIVDEPLVRNARDATSDTAKGDKSMKGNKARSAKTKSKGKRGKTKSEKEEDDVVEENDDTAYRKFLEEEAMDREIALQYGISDDLDFIDEQDL